jgi:anti-anti-sigma factor
MSTPPPAEQRVVEIQLAGDLDILKAQALEQYALEHLGHGARFFVIGFENVNLITSEGIRVMLEITRKLEPQRGALVMYGLNARVRTILSITRLIDRFQIVGSKQDAMTEIEARRTATVPSPVRLSSLTRLIGQVLGSEPQVSARQREADALEEQKSALAAEVARLLDPTERERSGLK